MKRYIHAIHKVIDIRVVFGFFCPFCAALNLETFSFQVIHCVLHNEGNTSHVIYKVYLYI